MSYPYKREMPSRGYRFTARASAGGDFEMAAHGCSWLQMTRPAAAWGHGLFELSASRARETSRNRLSRRVPAPGGALGGARVRLSRVGTQKCAILAALGCLVASTQLPWQPHARQPALLPCDPTICPCQESGARTRESPQDPSRHVTDRSNCHPEVDLFCSSPSTPQHTFPAPHFERKKSRRQNVESRENTANLIRCSTRPRRTRRPGA